MTLAFLKKKSVLAIIAAVVLIGGWLFVRSRANAGPFYDAQAAAQGTLVQTVEVTGETKPQTRVDLSFKTGGKLATIDAVVGRMVQAGDVLATLDAQDATFAMRRAGATLSQMRANLAARQAQDSPQAIQIAEAQRDQARAGLQKAQSDLEQVRATSAEQTRLAQIALDTAERNRANSGTGADLTVETSLTSLRASLSSALVSLSSALAESDALLGVENSAANDLFESVLGIYDRSALTRAQGQFLALRSVQRRAEGLVRALGPDATQGEFAAAGRATADALQQAQQLLDTVQTVLTNSSTNNALTITDLTAKRSSVQALRTAVAGQYTTISGAVQALQTSENARTTAAAQLENAVRTAQANLAIAVANERSLVRNAETAIQVQQAGLASAEATLSQRRTPARNVDLQVLRAQVQEAQIAYEEAAQRVKDTQLVAPVAGVIAEVAPARGEQVAPNAKVMGLVVTENYTVEASIPEADIAKVKVAQAASVTLDAFGDETRFGAQILSIEPDRVKIQDAVFYRVAIALDRTDRPIKPGMTANVTITTGTAENAVIIPIRAVRSEGGARQVRLLEGAEAKTVPVELGLRGDEGRVQVLSGVAAGDQVIVAELTADEYAQSQKAESQP